MFTEIVETGTGLHKLKAIIDVLPSTSADYPHTTGENLAKCSQSLSVLVNNTIAFLPDGSCPDGYWKYNSVCTFCPAGYECSKSSPIVCADGTYSTGGLKTCVACPSTCNNQGQSSGALSSTCQRTTGACQCNKGFSGYDCSVVSTSTPAQPPNTPVPTNYPGKINTKTTLPVRISKSNSN